ncbi:hypothetical protein [Shinella zoogloeoides]|uniref:hypothetical protein n=1 Tax=Shinella zoogloeoides TaxID=352475 RepID=UPI00299F32D9|nr:hypothetical protein [Shinella zoogloeoides]WPE19887.1 hypothetical protein ShzoTeo12_10630 [Shinella zoogloeoides]
MSDLQNILRLLRSRRFSLTDEKKLQAEIEEVLTAAGVDHKREHRLDAGSIIDFMIGATGVEVKIKGSKLNIFRQLERYAEFDAVECLVLVSNVPTGMPEHIDGKPVHLVNLAKAWL